MSTSICSASQHGIKKELRHNIPHFVSDLDSVVVNVSGQTRRVCGKGYSPLGAGHAIDALPWASGACTAQEQNRPSQSGIVLLDIVLDPLEWRVPLYMTTLAFGTHPGLANSVS